MGKTVLLALVLVAAVAAGLVMTGCARGAGSAEDPPGKNPGAHARADRTAPDTATGEATLGLAEGKRAPCAGGAVIADSAFDVADDRRLVGFADNVFVGRVAQKVGTKGSVSSGLGMPYTLFNVEVLRNVKGELDGVVSVGQPGGFDPEQGCVMLVNGDPLLRPGQEVLLATRYDERRRRHQIVASGYGDVRVRNRAHRDALVRRFEEAEKHQVDPTSGR